MSVTALSGGLPLHVLYNISMKTRTVATVARNSGLTVDADVTTLAGGATIAAGLLLSSAIGAAVAPVPTLGTVAFGAGITAFGQRHNLMGNGDDVAKSVKQAVDAAAVSEDAVPAAA